MNTARGGIALVGAYSMSNYGDRLYPKANAYADLSILEEFNAPRPVTSTESVSILASGECGL